MPATPEALPAVAVAAEALMRPLRLAVRAPILVLHIGVGLLLAAMVRLDFTRRLRPEPLAQWWNARLTGILGLHLIVRGTPLKSGHLAVANHVSWLDIPVMCACMGTRFVSKSEVQHWPVAGWLANAAGTFYLRRGKGRCKPLLARLVPHLQGGGSVVIYPEGTTSEGEDLLPFHARLFAAAIEASVPVQPVALYYHRADDGEKLAPFVGDDDLLSHLLRVLKNRALTVELTFCEPIAPFGAQREDLARTAADRIREQLRAVDLGLAHQEHPVLAS